MPPHEKEKRFGGEGRNMVSTALLMMIYLSFISLGLPDSMLGSAWPAMNVSLRRAALGRRTGADADFILHDYFQSEQRKTDPQIWNGKLTAISVATTALALLGFSLAKNYAFCC
ncbi:MAG: hypothetical protein ACLUN5_02400 [Oscillospiraceae bacterium]